jgi:hypothetical protein
MRPAEWESSWLHKAGLDPSYHSQSKNWVIKTARVSSEPRPGFYRFSGLTKRITSIREAAAVGGLWPRPLAEEWLVSTEGNLRRVVRALAADPLGKRYGTVPGEPITIPWRIT